MMEYVYSALVIVALFVVFGFRVIPENQFGIVERFGKYLKTIDQGGFYYVLPFIDRIIRVSKMEQELVFNYKNYDIKCRYQIEEPNLYLYGNKEKLKLEKRISNMIDEKGIDIQDELTKELLERIGIKLNFLKIK